jgi:predicted kinase
MGVTRGFLTYLIFSLSLAALPCQKPLENPRTRSGLSPAEYFSSPKVNGRPRFVMTIGMIGSGKSSWVRAAADQGWTIVSADQIRVNQLRKMRAENRKLEIQPHYWVTPEPQNAAHVFAESLRVWAYDRAVVLLQEAMDKRLPIIWDATNLGFHRVPKMFQAREAKYFVEGLIFETSDLRINERNLALRAQSGGLAIGNRSTPAFEILKKLQGLADTFPIQQSRVDPNFFQNPAARLPSLSTKGAAELRKFDVFNRTETVDVRDWSKLPVIEP